MASFCVEDFSFDNLKGLDDAAIRARFAQFRELTRVDPSGLEL